MSLELSRLNPPATELTPDFAQKPWGEEAIQFAAQCWCDDETKHIEMNAPLAMAVAKRIHVWMETAAQMDRDRQFYQELLQKVGRILGPKTQIADDGTDMQEPLALRVPEVAQELVATISERDRMIAGLENKLAAAKEANETVSDENEMLQEDNENLNQIYHERNAARTRAESVEADNVRLREALRPFAEVIPYDPDTQDEEFAVYLGMMNGNICQTVYGDGMGENHGRPKIRISDFRRAALAISQEPRHDPST